MFENFSKINLIIILIAIIILCCSIFAECILCDYVPIKFVKNEVFEKKVGSLFTFGSNISVENFENESFINVENPKLIYFSSTYCGYCTQYNPVWDKLVSQLKKNHPNINFVKVNAVEDKQTTNEYKVNYFPTLIFENKKGNRMMFKGNRNNYHEIENFIKKYI